MLLSKAFAHARAIGKPLLKLTLARVIGKPLLPPPLARVIGKPLLPLPLGRVVVNAVFPLPLGGPMPVLLSKAFAHARVMGNDAASCEVRRLVTSHDARERWKMSLFPLHVTHGKR